METSQNSPSQITHSPTHPLLLVAAASVTVLSLAGVGVLAGWLPGPGAGHGAQGQTTAAPAPISIQQHVTVPQEKPKAVARTAERAPAGIRRSTAPSAGTALAVSPAPTYARTGMESEYRAAPPAPAICHECGVVEAVREVSVEPKGSGGGAIAGGVLGGYIGNQWGRGATRDIATVLGAVGGAYAGNHIEKSIKESKRDDVVVRFEDGSTRTFSSDAPPEWHSGDRVRLQNGLLTMGGRSPGYGGAI
jgi:outer membrane lipoprotein SlyB